MLKDESFPKTEKVNKGRRREFYAFLGMFNEGAKPERGVRGRSPRKFLVTPVNKD